MPWNVVYVETGGGFDWVNAAIGLIGVLLGAALTYAVTRSFEKQRVTEVRLGQAYALVFTVQKMTDDLVKLHQNVLAARAKAAATGLEGPLWTALDDIVGFYETDSSLLPESLALLAQTKDVELLMEVQEVQAAHQIFLQVLQNVTDLRGKLEASNLQVSVVGETISYEASEEEYAKIAPTVIRLNSLSSGLEGGLHGAVLQAEKVCGRLGAHLKAHYKFKHFVTLSLPPQANGTGRPNDKVTPEA